MTSRPTTVNAAAEVVAMLRADSTVAAYVGSVNVYGQSIVAVTGEIDDEWAKAMSTPRRMILVTEVPGPAADIRNGLRDNRVDVRCYGAEPGGLYDAQELSNRVDERLFGATNRGRGVMVITPAGGPTPGREPDTEWAFSLRTYDVLTGG